MTVKECIKSKLFDDIRVKELEREAPYRIYLGCDEAIDTPDLDL